MTVLLVILRTLGDVVLGTALVKAVAEKYEGAKITFCVWPEYAEILENNPHINGLVIMKDWDNILAEMVKDRYDKVLVPYQTQHTDSIWHQRKEYRNYHLLDFYAERCGLARITDRRCFLYPSEKNYQNIASVIKEYELNDKKIILLHSTTLVPEKNWPYFNELSEELSHDLTLKDCALVQIGAESDMKITGTIDLSGKLGFLDIAALAERASLFIGLDSGLAYIADAMQCRTICIMGMSTQSTSGPISDRAIFIEPSRPEPDCDWPCHTHCRLAREGKRGAPCIHDVKVEQVLYVIKKNLPEREFTAVEK